MRKHLKVLTKSLCNQKPFSADSDDVKNSHPIWCTIALGTSTLCQLKVFLPSKKKGLLHHTVDNNLSRKKAFSPVQIGPITY